MRLILRVSALAGLTAVALTFAQGVAAQSIPSPYSFIEKGQGGELFTGYLTTDEGRFGFGPRSGITLGARYGLEISGPLGLDLVATILPTDRNVVNPARVEGDRVVGIAESTLVFVEARLRFALTGRRTWNRIQPYVYLGAGLGFDGQGAQREDQLLVESDRYEFGTRFSGSGGLGLRTFLADRWVLRTEGGFLLYQLSTPAGFADPARGFENVEENEWTNALGLQIGLAFLF